MNSVPEEEKGCAVVCHLSPYPRVTTVHYLYIVIPLGGDHSIERLLVIGYRLLTLCLSWSSALTYSSTLAQSLDVRIFLMTVVYFWVTLRVFYCLYYMYDTGRYAFSGSGPTKFFPAKLGLPLGQRVLEGHHETHTVMDSLRNMETVI